ncbi:tetratricopeptide repeat protein, partial [uncultured Ralstonia sp.]|uniref:tetratricopeptide repeat protein n=1 Tax=uncultured Ralstonia sp. TaxID=114715 RepID=UPI0025D84E0B
FQYSKLNYDLGIFAEAITAFKYFVDNYPNSGVRVEADALLTEAYLNTNKYDDAIKYIEGLKKKSQRINAAYQRLLFYFGVESFNKEQYLKAVQLFEKSLQYPMDKQLAIAANFWLGETYSTGNKYVKAIPYYLRVFEKTSSPKNEFYIKTMYGVGYAYFNTKQYKKALINFQRYVNHAETTQKKYYYGDAILRLADCYFVTKIYNEAIKYYDKAINYQSKNQKILNQKIIESDYAYFQKGVIYGITSNPDLAKKNLDMVIRRFSGSRYYDDALFQTAQIDFENGNNEDAITGFSRLIKVKPGSPFVPYALLKRGIAQENLQKYDKAIADYKKIIDNHTSHKIARDAISSLQQALTSAGKSENFDDYLAKFKQANPNSEALESIEFETAKALYYNQKYEEAISSFTNYLNNFPAVARIGNPSMPANPTMYYYDSKYYLAESYYRLAVEIEQKDSSGYGAAYNNALRYYKEVVDDNKSDYVNKSIYRIAGLEYKNHSYKSAIKYYDQLLEKASNKKQQFNAWTGLMLSYYGLSKFDKVEMYANEILSRGNASNRNKAMLYLGKAAYASGDHLKATDEFVNTLNTAKDANGAEAQYLLAELLYKDGNYKQSLETLFDLNQNFANYKKWVDKAFLLIADIYIAQDELFQAKATLNSIIEKSTSKETVEAAKVKLDSL